jgi:hypothetical protein
MIRGSPGCRWRNFIKTEIMQFKFVDEDIHYTDRVVVGDIVVENTQVALRLAFGLHLRRIPSCAHPT